MSRRVFLLAGGLMVSAEQAPSHVTVEATVQDAGSDSRIAYLELRTRDGESIAVTGKANGTLMAWLHAAIGQDLTLVAVRK